MIPCIATFYWRLFPLSRKMGQAGQFVTGNYDKVLSRMILAMLIAFSVAVIIAW
jgi:branched-subunit amino acid transport protein AzlD